MSSYKDMREAIQDLFDLLDVTDESSNGVVFHPNVVSSARLQYRQPLSDALVRLRGFLDEEQD